MQRIPDLQTVAVPQDGAPDSYEIHYYGFGRPSFREFRKNPDNRYKAEVIDTWNMTTTTVKDVFVTKLADNRYRFIDENGKSIKLPGKPYILLHIYSE